MFEWEDWREIDKISVKDLQKILKKALNKIEPLNICQRLGIADYDKSQITMFRRQCKNIKLRHIYYRLISRDFYTKERMFRFGMSRDDECTRCGETET